MLVLLEVTFSFFFFFFFFGGGGGGGRGDKNITCTTNFSDGFAALK